ncbi:asparagine synthase-related protein [Halobacterium yunchengense]|uniref:asparagine synthase-related protein n=1 Tax=Halobacterium yunchengense TaxID=3108497 RepID=UPI00300960B4
MTGVRVLFADPETLVVEGEHGTWVVSAVATNRVRDLVSNADGLDAVCDDLAAQTEDAVVVFVSGTDRGGRVEAYRSATSSRDVFYLEASDGTLVLADHFRNAVRELAVGDRTVDRTALADHLLFRSPVEPSTYVAEVSRLGRGECIRWDGADREWTRRVADTLETVHRYSPGRAVDALGDALEHVVRVGVRPGAHTMFSGGVDSTLLASYRRNAPSPVQVTVDAPEFRPEVVAAREAAAAIDASRTAVPVAEASFLDHLEAAVDALGLPPRYHQTVFTAAGFQSMEPGQYVNGQCADALFGLPGVKAARIADWLGPVVDAGVAEWAAERLGGRAAAGYEALAARRAQLQRPASSPESFAHALAADVDPGAVAEVFDADVVRRRANRRVEYAGERANLDADPTFPRQAEVGHLVDFLGDDAVNQWRQLGFVWGQDVVAPFRARRVAQTALAVPADRRYVPRPGDSTPFAAKHVPKALLSRRVPEYDVRRGKHSGSLPIGRYVEPGGPLASAFERYEPPAVLSPASYDRHVAGHGSLTWELLTFSVWRDRVLLADDLEPVPGTETYHLRLPREPAAPPT